MKYGRMFVVKIVPEISHFTNRFIRKHLCSQICLHKILENLVSSWPLANSNLIKSQKSKFGIQIAANKPGLVTCNEEGDLISPDFKQLERYLHRYWGNFARTGDPNNAAGAKYSPELQAIYDKGAVFQDDGDFGVGQLKLFPKIY